MKKIISLALVALMLACLFISCGKAAPAVKVIEIDLTEEEYAFGVDKTQPELLTKVNTFIDEIMANGKFDEICNNYFGDGTPKAVESAALDTTKDQLVVATNAAFEPFEYTLDGGKTYLGIDMEIAGLLADYLGLELVISNMEFEAVCLAVGQQKADIAMAGLTIKPEREEHVAFTKSYYQASQKLIVMADDTTFDACKTADDVVAILNEKDKSTKIGVQNGTTGFFYVTGDDDWGFDGYEVECKGYTNGSLAVNDMINGNLDYVIIDAAPADCIVNAYNEMN
ncbi:MAG: transporter substrate-binding domain-containing protein [Ruminococcaceae bacterium]|nr:transporter substrate-binding domain-containing protein [Oscillospiraceae bacterium]